MYVCIIYLLYLFICWWTHWLLPYLAYYKQCCYEHWGTCYLFKLVFSFSSGLYRGGESLDHMVVPFLVYWGTSNTVFHNSCTSWHSHQQCTGVPFSPHPCQHLFVGFWVIHILTGVRWYLLVVLMCLSLIISDIWTFFVCLLAICISSLKKCILKFSLHFRLDCSGFFDIKLYESFV